MTIRASVVFASVLAYTAVDAAPFTVNTTMDAAEPAGTVGDGICDVGGGQCTLRAAVQEANATAAADTITVPAGTFVLSVEDADDTSSDLDLMAPVTITGAGPLATIIDGNGVRGVFEVSDSATISGLTIRGGALEFTGGGIYAVPINPSLTLLVRDVQITGNSANNGAGIYLDGGAQVTLERVSITGNTGAVAGGAIEIGAQFFGAGTVTLRNTTVSGNVSGSGVGLVTSSSDGALTFEQATLVGERIGGPGTTTVVGSILDNGPGGTVCNGPGPVVSQGHNIEHGTSCGLAMAGDASGIDPQLGALLDHGGGTLTFDIALTSPAVDAAGACGLSEDQRGTPRPLDGDGNAVAACDVGAYELDPANPPTSTTSTTTTTTSTTTLPPACSSDPTFEAIVCRIGELSSDVRTLGSAGAFRDRLARSLDTAGERVTAAELASSSSARKTRKNLVKASLLVKKARAKIGARKGQKTFPDAAVRATLQSDADGIRSAIASLAGTL